MIRLLKEQPPAVREELAEELALTYAPWFFELYTELESGTGFGPTVLEDYQIKYLLDDSTFKITNKSRQAGGSLMVAMKKFHRALTKPSYRCDMVSINLRESIDKIRYIRNLYDTLPERWKVPLAIDNATSIGFHKGAKTSYINSIAASAAVRGGRKEVLFDEFAHMQLAEELFYAAAPAILNGDLTLDIVSTPKGNLDIFSKIWRNDKDHMGVQPFNMFSRHQFIWLDARRFVTDFDAVQHVWYQELHENMDYMRQVVEEYGNDKIKFFFHLYPWGQFQQEFCGIFINEADAVFPQALIQKCLRPPYARNPDTGEEEKEYLMPWAERPKGNDNQVFMGVDYGESDKDTDKTSIQILERLPNGKMMHRYSEVLTKEQYPEFPDQARYIIQVWKRFRATRVVADHTGLGRGINPFIREFEPDIPLDEITFDYVNKEQMVMKTKGVMERGELWIQQDDIQLQGQIRNIERKITESGRMTYHGKPHDDMFWALALAIKAGAYSDFTMYSIGGRGRLVGR